MKKLLLLALLFNLISVPVMGQSAKEMLQEIEGKWSLDDNNNVTFSKVIELTGLSSEDIYNRALAFFTYNYGDGESVIQVKDKEAGIIVGKGLFSDVHVGVSMLAIGVSTTHIIRIDIKEEKMRIIGTLQEYKLEISGGSSPSYSSCLVSSRAPIAESDMNRTVMSKAFYKSYKKLMETFNKIEKSVKEGNTSSGIENEDW